MTRGTILILLTLLMVVRFAAAATLYGTYQASASHTCADSSCTSAIDVITGTGSNTLQGASNFTANITEDSFYNPGNFQPGRILITSLSDSSEISGVLNLAWVPGLALPAFELTGTVEITGGTGPYAGLSGNTTVFGSGVFTGPTSASGALAFVPEPPTGSLWLLSGLALLAGYRLRVRGSLGR